MAALTQTEYDTLMAKKRGELEEDEEGFLPPPQEVCRYCKKLFDSNLRDCPHCRCPHCPRPNRVSPEGFDTSPMIDLPAKETVNHPAHYGGDTVYEAIKVIRAWELNFNLGNAAKYICRAGRKDSSSNVEDLRKAVWCLQDEIRHLENNG